jgi:hypothetical protein
MFLKKDGPRWGGRGPVQRSSWPDGTEAPPWGKAKFSTAGTSPLPVAEASDKRKLGRWGGNGQNRD